MSIIGSFTNWKDAIPLTKVGNDFSIILPLTPGIHRYKFIVDGEWKFSLLEPTCLDESGNVNNLLDTSHYNPKFSQTIVLGSGSIDKLGSGSGSHTNSRGNYTMSKKNLELKKILNETPKSLIERNKQQVFNELDFDFDAQATPPHLTDIYFVNDKEKKTKEVWRKEEGGSSGGGTEGVFRAFDTFNSITPPTHVVL